MMAVFFRILRLMVLSGLAQLLLLSAANAQAYRQDYPPQFSMSPKGVNVQTGRFTYETTDFSIGPLKLIRSFGDGAYWAPSYSAQTRRFGPAYMIDQSGRNGHPWTHNYASGIFADTVFSTGITYYRVAVDNVQYTFKLLADGNIVPAASNSQGMDLHTIGTGQYSMTDHSGTEYTFTTLSAPGNPIALQRALYANGSATKITYNSAGQPKLVSSNLGYAIVFDYDANQNISAACGFNTANTYVSTATTCAASPVVKVSYGYDAAGTGLISFTDTRGGVTTYTAGLTCISLVNSSTCAIQNVYGDGGTADTDQVITQTTATGSTWTYSYQRPPDPNDVPPVPCWPIFSSAIMANSAMTNGSLHWLHYDRGFLIKDEAPEGTTEYKYANGCWTQGLTQVEQRFQKPSLIRRPGGVREYYAYDSRGNTTFRIIFPKDVPDPKLVGGGDWIPTDSQLARCCLNLGSPQIPNGSLIYSWVYPPSWGGIGQSGQVYAFGCGSGQSDSKLCDKPTAVFVNTNETDYTYDPAHGGTLTETKPAPVAGGVRPQTRYAYTQRQAWVKNSSGTYSQTGENVWLLTSKSFCKTKSWNGTACVNSSGVADASDLVTTTYDYGPDSGPNNLLLIGVTEDSGTGRLNLRTSYTYDAQGNKISETKPLGAGAAPPPTGPVFSISAPAPVNEGANAVFTITKTGSASGTLTVNYATANITAVAPGDYTAKSGTLSFPAATTSLTVSVPTLTDSVSEGSETFKMTLSNPSAGASLGTSSATATINNVASGNQAPVANPDSIGSIPQCSSATFNLVANDTDPDGNLPLSLVSVSASNVAIISSTTVNITTSGVLGTKNFTYVVKDSLGATATGSATYDVVAGVCQ